MLHALFHTINIKKLLSINLLFCQQPSSSSSDWEAVLLYNLPTLICACTSTYEFFSNVEKEKWLQIKWTSWCQDIVFWINIKLIKFFLRKIKMIYVTRIVIKTLQTHAFNEKTQGTNFSKIRAWYNGNFMNIYCKINTVNNKSSKILKPS